MRKKLIALAFLAALLMLPLFSNKAANAASLNVKVEKSEKESNNTIETPNKISVDTVIGGQLSASSDKDWYEFTTKKAGYFNLSFYNEFINSSSSYWKMTVYDAEQKKLLSRTFAGNATVKEDTITVGVEAGTYYVLIESGYYHSANEYAFTVNFTEASNWVKEFNETIVTANPLKTNTFVYGTLISSSDHDWFEFTLPSDGFIWLTFGNEFIDSSSSYWKTTFYNEANTKIYTDSWVGNKTLDRDSDVKLGLPAGKYFVLVESGYYNSAKPYHFKVNYTKTNSWETEFNNTIVTANKKSYNTHINGVLQSSSDKDWYSFDVSKSGKVRIALSHDYINSSSSYWKVSIYDSGNNKITSQSFAGNALVTAYSDPIDVQKGTYYILVESGYYSSAVPYCVAAEYSTNGSFDEITYKDDDSKNDSKDKTDEDSSDIGEGSKITVGDLVYVVTDDDEVAVSGLKKSSKTTKIVIPATIKKNGNEFDVVSIKKNAFKGNKQITSVVIDADLDVIGANAFSGCKKITSLEINGDVCAIGSKAFYNCKALKKISFNTVDLEEIGSKAFYRTYKAVSIYVPSEVYKAYKSLLKDSKIPSKAKIIEKD